MCYLQSLWTFTVPFGFEDLYKYHPYANKINATIKIIIPNGITRNASNKKPKNPNRIAIPKMANRTANIPSSAPPMKPAKPISLYLLFIYCFNFSFWQFKSLCVGKDSANGVNFSTKKKNQYVVKDSVGMDENRQCVKTKDPEEAWNSLRFENVALKEIML